MRQLRLASTSAYKQALLARLTLAFETCAPGVDERALAAETPARLAARLAHAKADACAAPARVVIGADQVASLDGRILHKPGTAERNLAQLADCQGRVVDFHTAVEIVDTDTGNAQRHTDHTRVQFAARDRAALERYVAIEAPYDCAGGFKAEGLGIALFERIDSSDPTALIGLPMIFVARALADFGFDALAAP